MTKDYINNHVSCYGWCGVENMSTLLPAFISMVFTIDDTRRLLCSIQMDIPRVRPETYTCTCLVEDKMQAIVMGLNMLDLQKNHDQLSN